VSQVPRHQAGTATLDIRRISQGFVGFDFGVAGTRLRVLRRSPRPRRMFAWGHELVRRTADECVRPYAIAEDFDGGSVALVFGGQKAYTALETKR
jgi:hypothetical protein